MGSAHERIDAMHAKRGRYVSIRSGLASIPVLRRVVIKSLKLLKRDIHITNAWTGDQLLINSYHHKGYWYFGNQRESATMRFFKSLVREGDTVVEAGGHIGYVTQYFCKLVGPDGTVVVFEPGSNNLPYIRTNLRQFENATLDERAVSESNGTAIFYEDNVTGQNNSLIREYRLAEATAKSHGELLVRTPHEVDVVSLDSYVREKGLSPDFLKIDVEGGELAVLAGARETIASLKAMMVEVTEHHEEVTALLLAAGFGIFDECGMQHDTIDFDGNVFALR